VGDPRLDQVGGTLNALLDHLNQDRERMHGLASEVIRAQDGERARIGRELHESIAQSLAAVTYQLTAAENDSGDPTMAARLRAIRVMATQVLDEVDMLSHTVHPRVLNDLGLLPGLRHLARTVADDKHAIEVRLTEGREADFRGLGIETASVLYRVAQEAIQNAMRHAEARRIEISVGAGDDAVSLEVTDDGIGFSVDEATKRRPGMGLFTMRERVGLVRGEFTVQSVRGKGTSVRVKIPVARDTFKPVEALVQ
jgi:signal transduction histidine kinase